MGFGEAIYAVSTVDYRECVSGLSPVVRSGAHDTQSGRFQDSQPPVTWWGDAFFMAFFPGRSARSARCNLGSVWHPVPSCPYSIVRSCYTYIHSQDAVHRA